MNSATAGLVLGLCKRFSNAAERDSAMNHEWILDVLTDLGAYARKHDLRALAEQLDDTRHVASAEIATRTVFAASGATERRQPKSASHEGEARGAG